MKGATPCTRFEVYASMRSGVILVGRLPLERPRCAVELLVVPLDLVFDRAASQHAVVEDADDLEKKCIPGVNGPARTKLMLACGSEFTSIFVRSTECALR